MVDKNLFLYNLTVTAIFKDEARYIKEWLDYHLLAGVEHFYLYNNDSTDNYKEVLAPYIEKNLVTLTDFPGKAMQYPAYEDAIDKYRFECRYMAFIDIDEFIYPKSKVGGGILEVADEILSDKPNAAGLRINEQCFGSNGHEKADYSRGVLERFTRRAPSKQSEDDTFQGNFYQKTIDNPRLIRYRISPHFSGYFNGKFVVNSDGVYIPIHCSGVPILADKIVINHYAVKSREEFFLKKKKGRVSGSIYGLPTEMFNIHDRNEVFDDGILKYREARAKNFSFESDEHRTNRVINALIQTLTRSCDSFVDKIETFLTCRAAAEKFQLELYGQSAEEYALAWIYRTLLKANPLDGAEVQMFLKALPKILTRPFPVCKDIKNFTQNSLIPRFREALKNGDVVKGREDWRTRADLSYIQEFLSLIKL